MLQMIIITNYGILQNNRVFISYSTNIIVIFAKQLLWINLVCCVRQCNYLAGTAVIV